MLGITCQDVVLAGSGVTEPDTSTRSDPPTKYSVTPAESTMPVTTPRAMVTPLIVLMESYRDLLLEEDHRTTSSSFHWFLSSYVVSVNLPCSRYE